MLGIAIVDANIACNFQEDDRLYSLVSAWLDWEARRAGVELVPAAGADVILLAFSGSIDFVRSTRRALRKERIEPNAAKRIMRPYIITGGAVDAVPLTALTIADAVAVGEGVRLVRTLLQGVKAGWTVRNIEEFLAEYPHAVTRSQVEGLCRDKDRPWLLASTAPKLASPDDFVDWDIPPIRTEGVVEVIASKGCHGKCAFCATTYRQTYRVDERAGHILGILRALKRQGERLRLVSNDIAALPYYDRLDVKLEGGSASIRKVRDPATRENIARAKISIIRFGVEGLSERMRVAFGKPVANDDLVDIIGDFHRLHVNTHLFFIIGAPFEDDKDWDSFASLYWRLAKRVTWGVCRFKFTTFVPTPPAPLGRFLPGAIYADRARRMFQWINRNAVSRHLARIQPRGLETHIDDAADHMSVSATLVRELMTSAHTTDLAPTMSEFSRLPGEIIEWPIQGHIRWKIGNVYKARMTSGDGPQVTE